MIISRLASLTALAATLAAAPACIISDGGDSTLEVVNDSDFAITDIYLTDVGDPDWGPNLIGGDVLRPDESIVIDIDCGTYDALLIDEDGVECELDNEDLCFDDATWVIRNNTCSVFATAAAAAQAKAGN